MITKHNNPTTRNNPLGSSFNCGYPFLIDNGIERKNKQFVIEKSFKKRECATVDEDYGETEIDDVDNETYLETSKEFMYALDKYDKNQIFSETLLQSNSEV
ncbi:hypothetical protein FQA39_LY10415 [Lamprigera yunnana]|nr:hypothetical protein FQA39_LY10415 [Lamprigera yunnana]